MDNLFKCHTGEEDVYKKVGTVSLFCPCKCMVKDTIGETELLFCLDFEILLAH